MPNPEAIISLGRDLAELAAGEAKETGERLLMSSGAAAKASLDAAPEAAEKSGIPLIHAVFPSASGSWLAGLNNIPYVGPMEVIGDGLTESMERGATEAGAEAVENAAAAAEAEESIPILHIDPVAFPFQPKGIPYIGPAVILDQI